MATTAETDVPQSDPASALRPEGMTTQTRMRAQGDDVREHSAKPSASLGFSWLFSWIVPYAGLAAIVLAQFGYTMLLGVETEFGIARDSVRGDWSHLVSLGAQLFLDVYGLALDKLNAPEFYRNVLTIHAWEFLLLAVVAIVVVFFRERIRASAQKLSLRTSADTRKLLAALGLALFGTFGVMPTVLTLVVIAAMPIIGIPAFGLGAAKASLYRYVVEPEHCSPVQNLEQRRAAHAPSSRSNDNAVLCLAVTKEGKPREVGRVVMSGPGFVVLFDPKTGATRRVATDGATVEAIASME